MTLPMTYYAMDVVLCYRWRTKLGMMLYITSDEPLDVTDIGDELLYST